MKRITLAAIAIVALAATIWFFSRPEPVEVTVHRIGTGTVESTVANTRAGTVKACRRARLAPPAGGQVVELRVNQGDVVEKGALLMRFWNDDVAAQVRLAESELEASQAHAGEACLVAELAERELARTAPMHAQGLVSDEALDRAQSEARVRRSGCIAARATAEAAADRIAVARAAVARTELRAPFDGVVAEVTGEVGEFVTPSPPGIPTPPAVDLIERDCLVVSAPLDEVDAPDVEPGMPARITMDAFRDRVFTGTVRRVAPYVQDFERQARVVEVEIAFDTVPENAALLPGYSADAEIILETRADVLRIPSEALIEGTRVFVVDADGVLDERAIETGIGNWVWTEVRAGLAAGDRVVTSLGTPGLATGVPVTVAAGDR